MHDEALLLPSEIQSLTVTSSFDAMESGYTRFEFVHAGVRVPCLFWSANRAGREQSLVVMLNGAVQRKAGKSPFDVFQRRTWVESIESDVLFLADPTLTPQNRIQIGWGQGERGSNPLNSMAQCVEFVRDSIGYHPSSLLFFGSSAGGFQALQLHARFPSSRFIVNNAQLDWSKYHEKYVKTIARYSYGVSDLEHLRDSVPSWNLNALDLFTHWNSPINGDYYINLASAIDQKAQLPVALRFVDDVSGRTSFGLVNFGIKTYFDKHAGHNPLPKARTLGLINSAVEVMRGTYR